MLDTRYYLLPHLSVDIDNRVIDKYCKSECVQDPEIEECIECCDRYYKILARYQYFSVIIVGYDFCIIVQYPWSRTIRHNLKCYKCKSHYNQIFNNIELWS